MGPSPTSDPAYPYFMEFASTQQDMVPLPTGGDFGDLVSLAGVPGQNGATPSEKFFWNHQFIKYTAGGIDTYYDASYGITYLSAADFLTKAVAGCALNYGTAPVTLHQRQKVSPVDPARHIAVFYLTG